MGPWLTVLHLHCSHIGASPSDSSTTASSTSAPMMLKTLVMATTSSRMASHILSADGKFDAVYKGNQLVSKKRKAPLALPMCLQTGKGVVRDRPTQGWTVEEASLLCKVSIYSLTVQPWVGRWMNVMHPPWRLSESCT